MRTSFYNFYPLVTVLMKACHELAADVDDPGMERSNRGTHQLLYECDRISVGWRFKPGSCRCAPLRKRSLL